MRPPMDTFLSSNSSWNMFAMYICFCSIRSFVRSECVIPSYLNSILSPVDEVCVEKCKSLPYSDFSSSFRASLTSCDGFAMPMIPLPLNSAKPYFTGSTHTPIFSRFRSSAASAT